MQKQKKKQYTAAFKSKIVKEILREEKTVSQLSAEYGIHSSQLYKWRDQALAGLPGLFNEQAKKKRWGNTHDQQAGKKSNLIEK